LPEQGVREIVLSVEGELDHLGELEREMVSVGTADSTIIRRARGSILHDFYNCCERIFKSIAVEVNGGYQEQEQWHKALLHRMTLPLGELRPAVLSREVAADLDDYLSFRHAFRNIYGFELRGERVMYLSGRFPAVAERFTREIRSFLNVLEEQAKSRP
jgi:hypothetical protein